MDHDTLPRLLTAKDVSAQTGLAVWRIFHLAREGSLPVVRIGRSCFFTAEAIRKWLEEAGQPKEKGDK